MYDKCWLPELVEEAHVLTRVSCNTNAYLELVMDKTRAKLIGQK